MFDNLSFWEIISIIGLIGAFLSLYVFKGGMKIGWGSKTIQLGKRSKINANEIMQSIKEAMDIAVKIYRIHTQHLLNDQLRVVDIKLSIIRECMMASFLKKLKEKGSEKITTHIEYVYFSKLSKLLMYELKDILKISLIENSLAQKEEDGVLFDFISDKIKMIQIYISDFLDVNWPGSSSFMAREDICNPDDCECTTNLLKENINELYRDGIIIYRKAKKKIAELDIKIDDINKRFSK